MVHVDYVWVDGLTSPLIRSKTKIVTPVVGDSGNMEIPVAEWNFDGSSTHQATTEDSERIIQPQRIYKLSDQHYVALCEVCMPDENRTPHPTNYRAVLRERLQATTVEDLWLGFEQEFFFTKNGKNVMWPKDGLPIDDTRYYCSSGGPIKFRKLIREHASLCNSSNVNVVGYNTEVSPGQWEYQVFASDPLQACDDLWISRYLLQLSSETYGIGVNWHPKPYEDWNGSGCHTNFSSKSMRETGGEEMFKSIMDRASTLHQAHMELYGALNNRRMTGIHETSSYDHFTYAAGSRGVSIRIPSSTVASTWKGYAEDRRPASNCDPYRVACCVLEYVEKDV